jgi:peptidoglycan/LPS O-acetylase OafA/YrhL
MTQASRSLSPNLDLLRAAAVSCVFFSHLYETLTGRHTNVGMHFGQLGVIMFFVHTSLVLMQALDRSVLTGRALVREFLIHRFFRIYPLSVTCVLIAFLIPGSNWTLGDLLANLTLTMNLTYGASMVGGLWTLPLEVQMYLMLPFLFIFLRKRHLAWTFALWAATIPVALAVPTISGRLNVIEYIPCFYGGVIAWRLGKRASWASWAFPLVLATATLPWMLSPDNHMWARWITCTAIGLTIPWFREITWAPVNAIAYTVAKYSYGIYLTHVVALKIAFGSMAGQTAFIQILAFAAMAILLPVATFHLIESPMIAIGRRVTRRNAARQAQVALAGAA